jgi:hypothetical protein
MNTARAFDRCQGTGVALPMHMCIQSKKVNAMIFIASRRSFTGVSAGDMVNRFRYNLWSKMMFPYDVLAPDDTVFWYETAIKCIVGNQLSIALSDSHFKTHRDSGASLYDCLDISI